MTDFVALMKIIGTLAVALVVVGAFVVGIIRIKDWLYFTVKKRSRGSKIKTITCPACNGTGDATDELLCPQCAGKGEVEDNSPEKMRASRNYTKKMGFYVATLGLAIPAVTYPMADAGSAREMLFLKWHLNIPFHYYQVVGIPFNYILSVSVLIFFVGIALIIRDLNALHRGS